MDKVYGSSRPIWASNPYSGEHILTGHGLRDILALMISVALSESAAYLIRSLTDKLPKALGLAIFGVFSSGLCAAFVAVAFLWMKNRHTRFYPSTFVYCLRNPDKTSPSPFILGCFLLKCDELDGEFVASGESYLSTELVVDPAVHLNWESLHIGGSKVQNEERCFIVYARRGELLPSGVLSFSLYEAEGGALAKKTNYRGTLHFTAGSYATSEPLVYAEKIECDPAPDERCDVLRGKGQKLINAYIEFERKVRS